MTLSEDYYIVRLNVILLQLFRNNENSINNQLSGKAINFCERYEKRGFILIVSEL